MWAIVLVSIFSKWATWIREIIRFLLAVRKHNFLRTSPGEAHNALIRMPAEMKRNGAAVEAAGQAQMPWNLLSLKYTGEYKTTNTQANKAQSERTSSPRAPVRIYTASFTAGSGVRDRAGPILNRIHETHQVERYLPLSEYCIQLICDIWISH